MVVARVYRRPVWRGTRLLAYDVLQDACSRRVLQGKERLTMYLGDFHTSKRDSQFLAVLRVIDFNAIRLLLLSVLA